MTALLRIICPHCQGRASVGEHLAGRTTLCPNCQRAIKVPKANARQSQQVPAAKRQRIATTPTPTIPVSPQQSPAPQVQVYQAAPITAPQFASTPATMPAPEPPKLPCPHCGMYMEFVPDLAGQAVQCVYCTRQFQMPVLAGQPAMPTIIAVTGGNVSLATRPLHEPDEQSRIGFRLGLAGSALLFVGAFLPMVGLPIIGSFNYFAGGHGDGVLIVLLAVVSAMLCFANWREWLWITGLIAAGIMAYTFTSFHAAMHEAVAGHVDNEAAQKIKELAAAAVQVEWGCCVLFIAVCCIVISGALATARRLRAGDYSVAASAMAAMLFTGIAVGLLTWELGGGPPLMSKIAPAKWLPEPGAAMKKS